eukprot:440284_1
MGACIAQSNGMKQVGHETDEKNEQTKKEIKQPQMIDKSGEPNVNADVIDAKENKNTDDDDSEQTLNEVVTRRIINDCIQQKKETKESYEWSDIQKQLNINKNDPDIDKYKSMYEEEMN